MERRAEGRVIFKGLGFSGQIGIPHLTLHNIYPHATLRALFDTAVSSSTRLGTPPHSPLAREEQNHPIGHPLAIPLVTSIPPSSGHLPMSLPNFDFYVFSLTWQPSFCYGNYDTYPGCSHPNPSWSTSLTIHGLWPQYTNGTWPASCTEEDLDLDAIEEVGAQRMVAEWPNVKEEYGGVEYDEFWEVRRQEGGGEKLSPAPLTPPLAGDLCPPSLL